MEIDVVEIDEAVVSVATDWFNFTTDDRLRISVADGLEYIQQLDRTGNWCYVYFNSFSNYLDAVLVMNQTQ